MPYGIVISSHDLASDRCRCFVPPRMSDTVPARSALSLQLVLALGGFAIGTVEFASMSLLPQFTRDLQVSVPAGGQAISAYALGVVVGAPILAMLGASISKRALLAALMAFYAAANLISAVASSYPLLVASRFASGLPHGAYFGVACVLSASMVPPTQRARAVARVMLGLTVATIVGVPLANVLGRSVGWRWAFVLVAALAALTSVLVLWVAPPTRVEAGAGWRRELGALRSKQVWLTLGIGAIGQGGMFSVYTYAASTFAEHTHGPSSLLPLLFALFGTGMTLSLMVAGALADRAVMPTVARCLLWSMFVLAVYALSTGHVVTMMVAIFLVGASGGLVAPVQTRLMDVAGEAQSMAAALNHSAFNVANAIGPAAGGLALAAGWGWASTGWVGMSLAFGGLLVWLIAVRVPSEPQLPAST